MEDREDGELEDGELSSDEEESAPPPQPPAPVPTPIVDKPKKGIYKLMSIYPFTFSFIFRLL